MLEKTDLKKTMAAPHYKQLTGKLKTDLTALQHRVKDAGLPVLVLFEGWGTAGKGSMIADVILRLDPRSFKVYSTLPPSREEARKPFLWRHWIRVPGRGHMAIFDRSWYPEVSSARVEDHLKPDDAYRKMDSINTFERQLSDDGCLIIKFFLHLSQKEQEKRLAKLDGSKDTAWRASGHDWKRNRQYDKYYSAYDEMLERTDTPRAPWHIIGTHDRNAALAEIYRVLTDSIRQALAAKEAAAPAEAPPAPGPAFQLRKAPLLSEADLTLAVEREAYKKLLKSKQKRLSELHNLLYLHKIPVVAVYEGWDAAGKGGNIRRLVKALDPRGYEVIPVAAPSPYDLARHYLQRFWRELPKDGHIALFDRSWYGRVMVERLEGFCAEREWKRAYNEINEFEKELSDWGAVVLKFWLQIDQDEQLYRFTDRQNTPEKRWKITDEDWRNRKKWTQYETAVNDMLRLTSTEYAPWTVVESQDKRYGRLKTIQTFIDAVEKRLS